MKGSLLARMFQATTEAVDKAVGWHRLPRPLGIVLFVGIRDKLRRCNLHDSGSAPCAASDLEQDGEHKDATCIPAPLRPEPCRYARTVDGSYNDLSQPNVGRIGCRFGRNVPAADTVREELPGLLTPSPREVSRRLLTRTNFLAADTLNVLAAAWLQFEVHDWFSHGRNPTRPTWDVELAPGDDWWERAGQSGRAGSPMPIQPTRSDPHPDHVPGGPPTFRSTETHWWDASQLYGNSEEIARALRSRDDGEHRAREDGKLRMEPDGLPPAALIEGVDLAGVGGAFWVGLGLLHTLFMHEHNAICDRLRVEHPERARDDEWLYQHARLINCALMAKIHATEWTPAVIGHPTTRWGAMIEWYGLAGKWVHDRFGRMGRNELLNGIPGSATDHHGTPFSLTEEFVAVYRMHQLLPDHYDFRAVADDAVIAEQVPFPNLGVHHARPFLAEKGMMANSLYSFGVSHPGQVSLFNFPRFLQCFERPVTEAQISDGHERVVDLAAIDILRNRERGVPRYNDFRRHFHRRPVRSFEDLTPNPQWAAELRDVYEGDIDRVDLSVGLYAEPLPPGFAFSDTAFRVFILMATRRLKSDRFFTADYRPEIYTPTGLRWVEENTFGDVLVRHYPELAPALEGVDNAFKPWRRMGC